MLGQELDHTIHIGDAPNEMGPNLKITDLGNGKAAKQISTGPNFAACALLNDDAIKCWGLNEWGQLGQGHRDSLGDDTGEMGNNLSPVDLGHGKTAKQVAIGHGHACAILSDDTVKCWGVNDSGQLGQGHGNNIGDGPGEMGNALSTTNLGTARSAKQLAIGSDHTCALLNDGTVKCWGLNGGGQLGIGSTNSIGGASDDMGDNLQSVDLGSGKTAKQISAGLGHTCALLNDDTLKCWGNNTRGELGQGHTNALGDQVGELGDNLNSIALGVGLTAKLVSAGGDRTCAILSDDTLKCWGENDEGQLGLGHTADLWDNGGEMGDNLSRVNLGSGKMAKQVVLGRAHTCALLNDDSIKCWGANNGGALGQGHENALNDNAGEMGDNLPAVVAE